MFNDRGPSDVLAYRTGRWWGSFFLHCQSSPPSHSSCINFSWKSRERWPQHFTVDQQLDSFHSEAWLLSSPWVDFTQVRDEMWDNRHNMRELQDHEVNYRQSLHSDSTTLACGCWVLSAMQFWQLKFLVIQEHVQNHTVDNGHLVLPWMSEPQILHCDFKCILHHNAQSRCNSMQVQ